MLLSKETYIQTFTHTDGVNMVDMVVRRQSGAVRVRCLSQRHLDTQLGGARD